MKDWHSKALELEKAGVKAKKISQDFGLPYTTVKSYLQRNRNKTLPRDVVVNTEPKVFDAQESGTTTVTFGLIGDTHINSKYTQLSHLHAFYDECAKRGVTKVYHAGDIDEGEQMRPGHQYECYNQGADDHIKEIVSVYPRREGVTTYFITGNHDASMLKRCGFDIGPAISARRPDMVYLGRDCAVVKLAEKCTLELRHPWDGTAYALSYKLQKMIDSMEADSKPNILAVGHYHKAEYMFYRNIHAFQVGCFQSQTPFTRGKGISVHVAGWIVTVELEKGGTIKRIVPELIPLYASKKHDYGEGQDCPILQARIARGSKDGK